MTIFVAGKLRNTDRGSHGHWSRTASYRKEWRTRVALTARVGRLDVWRPDLPKTVHLEARVWNLFDTQDGLRTALKPVVDGLRDGHVIHNDDPKSGHTFVYSQVMNRKDRGVLIAVEPTAAVVVA